MNPIIVHYRVYFFVLLLLIGIAAALLAGCQPEVIMPTVAATVPVVAPVVEVADQTSEPMPPAVPPTWTPQAQANVSGNVEQVTRDSTRTPLPTKTPFPTLLPTLTLTSSPTPVVTLVAVTDTPQPLPVNENTPSPVTPNPVFGENLLPNSSFEEGHYNMNGIPELQLPVGWVFEWDEGRTGFGTEIWDVYVRPETRVLSTNFLPVSEHSQFIFDGTQTIKAFKGEGAISFKLFRDVDLQPGKYVLEINLFPDLYMDYQNNMKIWADDPLTGQFRFIAPEATGWMGTVYGRKNTFTHTFTVDTPGTVRIGAGIRGNHAIMNDGWFLDDWSLRRVEN